MSCKYTCSKCGKKFDKYSGQLVNLSDQALKWYYKIPIIQRLVEDKKHTILCYDCIKMYHSVQLGDFKYKKHRWLTSNLANVAIRFKREDLLLRIKEQDENGVQPYSEDEYPIVRNLMTQ